MKNIRKTLSYQIIGIIGCFVISVVLYLNVLLKKADTYWIGLPDSYFNIAVIAFVITLISIIISASFFVFSFFEKTKDNLQCDIMADIGIFCWLIIVMVFFNFCGIVNYHRIMFGYKKNFLEVEKALDKISEHRYDKNFTNGKELEDVCGKTSDNLTNCMAQFLPRTYKQSENKIITDDGKTYTFVAQKYCCHENVYSSPGPCAQKNTYRCYIDINDNNSEGLYVKIWLDELGGKIGLNSINGLKEFRNNGKVLRYIGISRRQNNENR